MKKSSLLLVSWRVSSECYMMVNWMTRVLQDATVPTNRPHSAVLGLNSSRNSSNVTNLLSSSGISSSRVPQDTTYLASNSRNSEPVVSTSDSRPTLKPGEAPQGRRDWKVITWHPTSYFMRLSSEILTACCGSCSHTELLDGWCVFATRSLAETFLCFIQTATMSLAWTLLHVGYFRMFIMHYLLLSNSYSFYLVWNGDSIKSL